MFWKFLVNEFHQKKGEGRRKKTQEPENGNVHKERQKPWFPEWREVQDIPPAGGSCLNVVRPDRAREIQTPMAR